MFRKNHKRQHFSDIFIRETVKDFIQGRSSYAVIRERKNVSIGTLSNWVHQFGLSCMTPVEISGALRFRTHNKWSGILVLDAKYLNKRSALLLAIDYQTLDIVGHLVCDSESEKNYLLLINMVETTGYVIRALISDGEPSIIGLTQQRKLAYFVKGTRPRLGVISSNAKSPRLSNIPHQWCVVHAEREIKKYIAKLPREEQRPMEVLIHQILFANTIKQAERAKDKLIIDTFNRTKIHQQIVTMILTRWKLLMTHHIVRVNGRKIPRSTNSVENIISYINTRLKTLRRLRNSQSAEAICNLIVVNFRSKPLINTKNQLKRGKSPLELAIGKKHHFDWMGFIKKSTA